MTTGKHTEMARLLLTVTLCSSYGVSGFSQPIQSMRGPLPNALSPVLPISVLKASSVLKEPDTMLSNLEETNSAAKSYLDDGFVFGLEGSGLERPGGKTAQLVVDGDSLETQPWQIALVSGTFLGHAAFSANAFAGMLDANGGDILSTSVQSLFLLFSSWVLADFGSGVLHWSVDNYGNGRTPIMGGIIAAFQGHHSAPWTITEREFCNNVCKLCLPFGILPMALISLTSSPFVTFFFTFFCALEIGSQEFHKWSHMKKSEVPAWVLLLQESGLTIDRKPHAQHHMSPFDGNYCIVSGACNTYLDSSGFFRKLERVVYSINGVESNAWKIDPELRAKTLRGDYSGATGRK